MLLRIAERIILSNLPPKMKEITVVWLVCFRLFLIFFIYYNVGANSVRPFFVILVIQRFILPLRVRYMVSLWNQQ